MTQTQWGREQAVSSKDKLPFMREVCYEIRVLCDKHFGDYDNPAFTLDDLLHDFDICFRNMKSFETACHNLDVMPEVLKMVLQEDFITHHEKQKRIGKQSW